MGTPFSELDSSRKYFFCICLNIAFFIFKRNQKLKWEQDTSRHTKQFLHRTRDTRYVVNAYATNVTVSISLLKHVRRETKFILPIRGGGYIYISDRFLPIQKRKVSFQIIPAKKKWVDHRLSCCFSTRQFTQLSL